MDTFYAPLIRQLAAGQIAMRPLALSVPSVEVNEMVAVMNGEVYTAAAWPSPGPSFGDAVIGFADEFLPSQKRPTRRSLRVAISGKWLVPKEVADFLKDANVSIKKGDGDMMEVSFD